MTLFWIIIGGIVAAVLLLLMPALLRNRSVTELDRDAQNVSIARDRLSEIEADYAAGALDEAEYLKGKEELEQALATDLDAIPEAQLQSASQGSGKLVGLIGLALIPLAALVLYFQIGNPEGLGVMGGPNGNASTQIAERGATDGQGRPIKGPDGKPLPSVDQMVASLAAKLAEDPDNPDGWILLGRSYAVVQRYGEAADAYQEALNILGDNTDVMAALAETTAMAHDKQFAGKPQQLLERALAIDPKHASSLWLSGVAATQAGKDAEAIGFWTRLQKQIPQTEAAWNQLNDLIVEAGKRAGIEVASASSAEPAVSVGTSTASASTPGILVHVSLASGSKADPDDTVFIFAKAMQGPPMPLAAVRKQVKDLPLTITLDDSMAMMPQMRLSQFKQVKVGARVSKSGDAMAASGGLTAERLSVSAGDSVELVIGAGAEQAPQAAAPTEGSAAGIQVHVSLPQGSEANPNDTVFIFAKALQGPPMPLAAVRKQVKDLPLTITLDDSMAMMPQMRLSQFKSVKVSARVSKSGNPIARPGDLYGEIKPVSAGQDVDIVIDQVK